MNLDDLKRMTIELANFGEELLDVELKIDEKDLGRDDRKGSSSGESLTIRGRTGKRENDYKKRGKS